MSLPLVTLILLGLWPFVSFLNNNQDDSLIYGASIAGYALIVLVLVVALFAAGVWKLGQKRQAQLAHVLGIGTVATFLYLPLSSGLSSLNVSLGSVRIAVWLFVTIALLLVVWRVSKGRESSQVFVVIAAVMVGIPAADLSTFLLSGQDADGPENFEAKSNAVSVQGRPNVYWFVFDAYARADVLKDYFGFDNNLFLDALEKHGLRVSNQSWANYASTKLSISTTASMKYYLPVGSELHPSMWTARLQGFNPVVDTFKSMGYRYVHVEPGGNNLKTRCGGREDLCVTASPTGLLSINEAEVGLLKLTPLFPVARRIFPDLLSFDFTTIDDVLGNLDSSLSGSQFVFAHILAPHPPQRFDRNCGRLEKIEFDLSGNDYAAVLDGYINDLRCLNPRIIGLVEKILDRDDSDPIFILQSDHGLRADLSSLNQSATPRVPVHLVPYANLHALRTSGHCDHPTGDDFSSVNTFRYVFACIDRASAEFLPNKLFGKREGTLFEIKTETSGKSERSE